MPSNPVKILFIGPHRPNRNPSQRFRIEQFIPYLEKSGFKCEYSWFLNEKDDKRFYSSGNTFQKLWIFLKAIAIRLRDVLRANRYDIIFIQREAFMTGSVFFERMFSRSKAKVVFDFDDAIWLDDISEANQSLRWLKRPSKTAAIISFADLVIAGNDYLARYAGQYNENVVFIPTSVDLNRFNSVNEFPKDNNTVVIGWMGSKSTLKHFQLLIPVLELLKKKYGEKIIIKVIAERNNLLHQSWINCIGWDINKEIEQLNSFDIGLMPLPDEEWSKGKCGFKAIEYMAMKVPPVVSAVGVNINIINHGINGFIAQSNEEWFQYLSALIESAPLRKVMGENARKTVEEKYAVQVQEKILAALFRNLITAVKN